MVGPGAQLCTLLEVWVLGVGMSTPGAQTALYAEDRGLQVPMALEHGPVTSSGKAAPGPDPRIRHRIQIGMFRPIRVDHTNYLQVAMKTHSMISPWTIYARKTSRFLQRKENLLRSTRSRTILPVKRCQTVVVVPYIVSISMGRGVISTRELFILRRLRRPGLF